jgi:hypothetical protein
MDSENQVTGLCAFDQEKVNVDRLRHLATLHPLSSAAIPVPQFRLFAESGNLSVEGELDSFAVSQLPASWPASMPSSRSIDLSEWPERQRSLGAEEARYHPRHDTTRRWTSRKHRSAGHQGADRSRIYRTQTARERAGRRAAEAARRGPQGAQAAAGSACAAGDVAQLAAVPASRAPRDEPPYLRTTYI